MVSNHGTPAQDSQITIFYPFYSRANDVIFFENKWDKSRHLVTLLLPRRDSSHLKHKSRKRSYYGSLLNRTLMLSRVGRFDEQYRARGYVTRYFPVIVGRICLRNVSELITGLFRVPPFRNHHSLQQYCSMFTCIYTNVEEILTNMENISKQYWGNIASILSAIGVLQKNVILYLTFLACW